MDKLKTMVRKTEDRQQLGELMALVAEKTTVAVAHKPDRTESKVLSLCNACRLHVVCCARCAQWRHVTESHMHEELTALSARGCMCIQALVPVSYHSRSLAGFSCNGIWRLLMGEHISIRKLRRLCMHPSFFLYFGS